MSPVVAHSICSFFCASGYNSCHKRCAAAGKECVGEALSDAGAQRKPFFGSGEMLVVSRQALLPVVSRNCRLLQQHKLFVSTIDRIASSFVMKAVLGSLWNKFPFERVVICFAPLQSRRTRTRLAWKISSLFYLTHRMAAQLTDD